MRRAIRNGKYPGRFWCSDSSTRCALQWRRVRNRAAEGAIGVRAQRERRKPPSPFPAGTRCESEDAAPARGATNISWQYPEAGACNFRSTNREFRHGHGPRSRSRDGRHRRRTLGAFPCPSNVRCLALAVILVVFVPISKSRVSRKHKESQSDDGKPFSSFQEFPPTLGGLVL